MSTLSTALCIDGHFLEAVRKTSVVNLPAILKPKNARVRSRFDKHYATNLQQRTGFEDVNWIHFGP